MDEKNVKLISQLNEQVREIELDQSHMDSELSTIAEQSEVLFISKIDLVCPQGNCDFLLEDQFSYSDTSHWTLKGSKFFGARLVEHDVFKKLIAQVKKRSPPVLDPATEADSDPPPPVDISVKIAGICNIESIGDLRGPALDVPVQVQSDTIVTGWRTYQAADGTEAPAWLRVVGQDGGVVFQIPLPATVDRPGVAKVVNRASALRSGFGRVKAMGLPQGSHTLEVVLNAGPRWVRCRHTRQVQVK
ncbi:MAG: hypothetical protein IPG64_00890 [Haliea sp.]|nr:hypothetical protein [Haliea sp.]